MFIVESIAKIRRMYYVDGKGIRAIGRELNISKNTVKKVIRSDATKFELTKYTMMLFPTSSHKSAHCCQAVAAATGTPQRACKVSNLLNGIP